MCAGDTCRRREQPEGQEPDFHLGDLWIATPQRSHPAKQRLPPRVVAELVKSDGWGELSAVAGVCLIPPTGAFAIGPPGCQAGGNDAARSSTGASEEK
jgi:hypothetical protein